MSRRPDPKSPPCRWRSQRRRCGSASGRRRSRSPRRRAGARAPAAVCPHERCGLAGRRVSTRPHRAALGVERWAALCRPDAGANRSGAALAVCWRAATGNAPEAARQVRRTGRGLAEACEGLPDDPAEGQPVFAARLQAQAEHLAATDWARDSYAGEVARDGSLRIVVTPDRSAYRLQWIAKRDIGTGADWVTLRTASTLSEVWAFVREHVGSVIGPGRSGVLRGDAVEPRWRALVAGLPDSPAQAHVPALPAPRSTLQAPARNEVKGA